MLLTRDALFQMLDRELGTALLSSDDSVELSAIDVDSLTAAELLYRVEEIAEDVSSTDTVLLLRVGDVYNHYLQLAMGRIA